MPNTTKRWHTVRPWQPPASASASASDTPGGGQTSSSAATTFTCTAAATRTGGAHSSEPSSLASSRRSSVDSTSSVSSCLSSPSSSSSSSSTTSSTSASTSASSHQLQLQVLDVTSTAVVLSVTSALHPTTRTTRPHHRKHKRKEPTISIQLNGQDWSRVAHAGPTTAAGTEADDEPPNSPRAMTVIVYGLDQGSEYEIGLEVVKAFALSSRSTTATATGTEGTSELQPHQHHHHHHQRGVIQVETPLSNATLHREDDEANTAHPSTHRATASSDYSADPTLTSTSSPTTHNANEANHASSHSSTPDGPPPPYSPSPSPLANHSLTSPSASASTSTSTTHCPNPSSTASEPTDEPHLRAQLKNIRASSKRTESVLQASISALKKSVEKALKEDQRARTRMVGLEEAIRKATEGEKFMRLEERGDVEGELERLVREEEERGSELKRRKEGAGSIGKEEGNRKGEEEGNGGGNVAASGEVGVGELMKELDALNVKIEEKDKDERKKLQDAVKRLEAELTRLDNEFIQLDREETHRYHMAMQAAAAAAVSEARLSSDSLLPSPTSLNAPPSSSLSSGFNLKWRRNPSQGQQPPRSHNASSPPITSAIAAGGGDPRSFGRFWRKNAPHNVLVNPPNSNSGTSSLLNPDDLDSPRTSFEVQNGSLAPNTYASSGQQGPGSISDRQYYAQVHQAMWGNGTGPTVGPVGSGSGPTGPIAIDIVTSPRNEGLGTGSLGRRTGAAALLRRSGSANAPQGVQQQQQQLGDSSTSVILPPGIGFQQPQQEADLAASTSSTSSMSIFGTKSSTSKSNRSVSNPVDISGTSPGAKSIESNGTNSSGGGGVGGPSSWGTRLQGTWSSVVARKSKEKDGGDAGGGKEKDKEKV